MFEPCQCCGLQNESVVTGSGERYDDGAAKLWVALAKWIGADKYTDLADCRVLAAQFFGGAGHMQRDGGLQLAQLAGFLAK